MKRAFILFFMMVVLLMQATQITVSENEGKQLFNVIESDLFTTSFEFSLDKYESEKVIENGREYLKISYWNEGEFAEVGKPDLPCFTRLIAIPDYGTVSIEINSTEEEYLENVLIYPRQRLMSDSEPVDRSFVIDEEYYNSDRLFPDAIVKLGKPAIMRDLRIVPVTINPFQYNPRTKKLKIIKNIQLSVNCNGYDGINTKKIHHKRSRAFEPLYRSTVLNYAETNSREEEYQTPSYLFIYPNDTQVASALQGFLDWKHQKGFVVNAVSTAETGTSLTSIKNYLQNAYDTWEIPPEYVCLVGDAGGSFDIPTGSMNGGEGDQFYALLEGNDILADVIIGRFSFNSLFELNTIIYKILSYEKEPYMENTDWYTHALLVGDPSSSGQSTIITKKNIKELIIHNEDNYSFSEVYSGSFATMMNNNLNNGAAYFNYRGYIGMSGWGNDNMDNLNNGFMLPFAGILTCGTGNFSGTYDCRSEHFVKIGAPGSPKGAIAAVGTATAATHTCFNNCVDAGMFYGIFVDKINSPGTALVRGKLNLYLNYPQNPNNAVYKFSYWNNLMGDPGMELWTNVPQTMLVTYNPQVSVGTNYMTISVEEENHVPIANAWVTLLKGDDEIFVSGYTDENGDVTLPIDVETVGEMNLTVTKHNYVPYLGNVDIIQPDVFVDVYEVDINDAAGNNDGNLNPNENAELIITLKNYGTTTANSVVASISSESEYVTITENTENYGTIVAGATAISNDNFQINIHPDALGGTEIVLDILISDALGNEWTDKIYLIVEGPNLNESEYAIIDGNNSWFDPGETVELKVTLHNAGSLPISDVVGIISCNDNNISIDDEEGYFDYISANGNAENNNNTFSLTSSTTIIPGTQIILNLHLYNAAGYDDTISFPINVGNVSITDPLGPDAYGYYCYDDGDTQFINAPTYNWIEIDPNYGGNGNILSMNDNGNTGSIQTIDIPLNFKFYGENYSQITICSNGWIAPGITEQYSFMNWHIPGPLGPSPMIAPFWDDLTTSSSGHVCYYYDSSAHYLIVEWSHMANEYNNAEETFQAILYDNYFYPTSTGDSQILFQYKTINNVDQGDYSSYHVQHGQYATVGLEDQTGTIGLEYTFNNTYPTAAKHLQNEMAILFTGPPIPHEEPFIVLGGTTVNDENGNGNGNADFGENIDLYISLNNLGENEATNVVGTISSTDEYLTINSNSSNYDNIIGGTSQYNLEPFNISIAENVPDGHIASFQMEVTSNEDSWSLILQLVLNAPNVEIDDVIVVNDSDGDGILDPGETADLIFNFRNSGGADAVNLTATLSTSDNNITINNASGNIANLEAGSNDFITFNVTADSQIEIGHTVLFQTIITADGNYTAVNSFYMTIGLSIEDFETGDFSGYPWTFGGNASWQIASDSYEGNYCAQSEDISDSQYSSMQVELNVLSAGQISFWKKVSSETNWDYLRFYIDGNEVENWSGNIPWSESSYDVSAGSHTFTWSYTKDGSVSSGSDCAWIDYIVFPPVSVNYPPQLQIIPTALNVSLPIYSTLTDSIILSNIGGGIISYEIEIEEHTSWIDLETVSGVLVAGGSSTIYVNFDSNNTDIGEYNCDIIITDNLRNETIVPVTMTVTAVEAEEEILPSVTKLGFNFPNPVIFSEKSRNDNVTFHYQLAQNSKVTFEIYNIKGQKIKTLLNDEIKGGYHSVVWNGNNEQGKKVSSGIYFYRMTAENYSKIRKMIIIK